MSEPIFVSRGDIDCFLLPKMSNRHGLVAGATGTGKTVTLQRLAEGFSRLGVPVFLADVKGDLSGLSQTGTPPKKPVAERVAAFGMKDFVYEALPVVFWDVFGEQGHPVRATISEMGPLLLGRLLDLNETQSGVLAITFKVADDNGLLLLDLKDLRAMLQYVSENSKKLSSEYGNVSAASVGAIQRGLLKLESQGGDKFFGEPALQLADFMQTQRGKGVINILAADKLMQSPQLYATFLLWMLAELYESLPEVGDLEKPKIVFFFDEAHLLFTDAPKSLMEKIEQVVRLIRSKGVGVYFVTQNPLDVPETVLAQLGNRVQHALRAFTPRDQKAVATAAQTFRPNPNLDVEAAITELAVGEALVSFLDEKGTPGIVQRSKVVPPGSFIGPVTPEQRKAIIESSVVFGHYEKAIDRVSAYEILKGKVPAHPPEEKGESDAPVADTAPPKAPKQAEQTAAQKAKREEFERKRNEEPADTTKGRKPAGPRTDGVFVTFAKSAARSVATAIGGIIKRGLLDTIFGSKKRR